MMPFDPLYLLIVGPFMLLALLTQFWVHSAFKKWSKQRASTGLSGAQVAAEVLRAADVSGVRIEETHGFLGDHYDPRTRTLRLSRDNFHGASVAAAAIAAHEAGHAIQHARLYGPLRLRALAVPAATIGGNLAVPLFLVGMIFNWPQLAMAGIVLFSAVVLFQLITLPVEFDASARAKSMLAELALVRTDEEARGVSAVLTAAAMTYVAATVQAIATLLYFLLRSGVLGGNRD